jgi:hypothetical protein
MPRKISKASEDASARNSYPPRIRNVFGIIFK